MHAVAALEPVGNYLSLKSSPQDFATLTERPGIIPAPYLARAKWIAVEHEESVSRGELKQFLAEAHRLVLAALPKRTRAALSQLARKRVRKPRAPAKRKRGTAR